MAKLIHEEQRESNYRQHYELYLKIDKKDYDQKVKEGYQFVAGWNPLEFKQFMRYIGIIYNPIIS